MVIKPFFRYSKTKVILASIVLFGTTIGVSADALEDRDTPQLTTRTYSQISQRQIAQASTVIYPTLRNGSVGESVSRLQATLKLLGFYQGEVNGTYNELTQQAVASFQSAVNLSADGITGPATWRKLLPAPNDVASDSVASNTDATSTTDNADANSNTDATSEETPVESTPEQSATEADEPSPPVLRPSAEGPAVSQLQRELQTLGYYDGTIDGKYGALTEAAVRAFQADQQLIVDAIVGPSTWTALTRELQN
ncbi:Putative peptidoglycan binding domain protein [Synechococcus sp. PCC 7335]|uniref:peptidoglycan-binding domain-containing protein n=1 Tax=Synechococcus sp. (strain ATCC 29403 / PCC 7335) TaxID=91464 RepID=UPI00017EB51F|nr:peptidoglycan-binding protein [Synechococcus sp. PCC 7335]EDX87352.1 Putative peptidoglycan binding domain protein [Synechococcus sp. PCC 7335]